MDWETRTKNLAGIAGPTFLFWVTAWGLVFVGLDGIRSMSLRTAEKIFWEIVGSEDAELAEWVAAWSSSYASPRYSSYEEGEDVRSALREFGFEPTTTLKLSHSRIVSLGRDAAADADVSAAASVFLLSANPDQSQFQNPLRAVSIIKHLPKHRFTGERSCDICGEPKEQEWRPLDAAKRFPSGYTGEDWNILDNLMIVRWFHQADCPEPTANDLTAFRRVLKIVAQAPAEDNSVKIAKQLKKELKGHIDSWRYFFETLGYAGVLKTDAQPGNLQTWTNRSERRYGRGGSEVPTPCCHWRRSMGFAPDVFASLFPQIKLPASLKAK